MDNDGNPHVSIEPVQPEVQEETSSQKNLENIRAEHAKLQTNNCNLRQRLAYLMTLARQRGTGATTAPDLLSAPERNSLPLGPNQEVSTAGLSDTLSTASLDYLRNLYLDDQCDGDIQAIAAQIPNFDDATLLDILSQLRADNVNLEQYVLRLLQRRDNLLETTRR